MILNVLYLLLLRNLIKDYRFCYNFDSAHNKCIDKCIFSSGQPNSKFSATKKASGISGLTTVNGNIILKIDLCTEHDDILHRLTLNLSSVHIVRKVHLFKALN